MLCLSKRLTKPHRFVVRGVGSQSHKPANHGNDTGPTCNSRSQNLEFDRFVLFNPFMPAKPHSDLYLYQSAKVLRFCKENR